MTYIVKLNHNHYLRLVHVKPTDKWDGCIQITDQGWLMASRFHDRETAETWRNRMAQTEGFENATIETTDI